ncbi:3'-5' exonuclease [Evansella cellulosilytica]|uniref:Exonuclease RNase T and DNA polymerase III n=1 Tax=Evansella cellulosilytica (strain ATCC 21833 / DSM 2522 / FERM P-1141 / JCM 9156 / N-4) TaxID=649639 RepID=E6U0Y4_EVAC2|nr:3'-5' exonuclease [Evansella cellulosilytica]ADU30296.1 Exonuclease RNase T and DNA polymerase III [Evansella cellulosilytica DSM 2522]
MAQIKQYIFFDFEMLCSNKNMSFREMEAIRLGAVKYDIESETVSTFDHFIKPINDEPLSAFCKNLTRISEENLKNAKSFPVVFADFLRWIGGVKKSRFFSWSKSDLSRLIIDSKTHHIPLSTIYKIKKRYIDFQAIFSKRVSKNTPSVENALKLYELSFKGQLHNPVDDAYNTLRIYLSFLNEPLKSDFIMISRFILDGNIPPDNDQARIEKMILEELQDDIKQITEGIEKIYKITDACKLVKRIKKIVDKYHNVSINRSKMFSNQVVTAIQLLTNFYEEMLQSYQEHASYNCKVMLLDGTIAEPISFILEG